MRASIEFGASRSFRRRLDMVVYAEEGSLIGGRGGSYAIARAVTDPEAGTCESWAPVTMEFVQQLARGLGSDLPREILPAAVLCRTHEIIAWWTPPQIRTLFFRMKGLEELDGEDFPVPSLIWRLELSDRRLFVRALAGAERPEPKTPLFIAPFLNVYPDGLVCQGTMRRPKVVAVEKLQEWESGFFGAAGSSQLTPKATTRRGQLPALWRAMKGRESFPRTALAPSQQTAAIFLETSR